MPDMSDNPEEYRPVVNKNGKSPAWVMMNAQVTKKFRLWEIYLGGENMLNYRLLPTINLLGNILMLRLFICRFRGLWGMLGLGWR
jgi:hypothetical protein